MTKAAKEQWVKVGLWAAWTLAVAGFTFGIAWAGQSEEVKQNTRQMRKIELAIIKLTDNQQTILRQSDLCMKHREDHKVHETADVKRARIREEVIILTQGIDRELRGVNRRLETIESLLRKGGG